MTDVSASLVKELREITGAGMMDCKKALNENNAKIDAAVDWLRSQGLAAAAKKSGRVASEGLICLITEANKGAMIELNSETDFVARNEIFQEVAGNVCKIALSEGNDLEKLKAASYPGGGTVSEQITHQIATIGENLDLRRAVLLTTSDGVIVSYMHNSVKQDLGKIGVLVALDSEGPPEALVDLGKQLAMHIAAANPLALDRENVDQQSLNRERAIYIEQAQDTGKAEEIIEKMVEGRLRKYYSEICLLEQPFVIDPDITVDQAIQNVSKEIGSSIKVQNFVRFALGEGIVKEEENFAAEVAAATKNV